MTDGYTSRAYQACRFSNERRLHDRKPSFRLYVEVRYSRGDHLERQRGREFWLEFSNALCESLMG